MTHAVHNLKFIFILNNMMNTSSKALYDHFDGNASLHPAILTDLCGYINWTSSMKNRRNDTLDLILSVYKGLYLMDVTHNEVHRCFQQNKLDELIHTKYSLRKSGYYKDFCKENIVIGQTYVSGETEDNTITGIFIYDTIQPPYHQGQINDPLEYTLEDQDTIIETKLKGYKRQDEEAGRSITNDFITLKDVKKLLYKQEYKCYICADKVLTDTWEDRCLYQFTLDRIDNSIAHVKTNCLIACYYCNCFAECDIDCSYKICPSGCHSIERDIERKRSSVPIREIDELCLKV